MTNPADLLGKYVRVYSAALGSEDQVMAEGRVVWYQEAPTIGIEGRSGGQRSWSTRMRIEEIEAPAMACSCPEVDVRTLDTEAEQITRGLDPACPIHGNGGPA